MGAVGETEHRRAAPEKPTRDDPDPYFLQLRRIPVLRAEEEVELAKAIEAGLLAQERLDQDDGRTEPALRADLQQVVRDGRAAHERMVTSNLRLVVSIAQGYVGSRVPLPDIVQDGNIGLLRAVERFDYTPGFKFSTFATHWIRQSITRELPKDQRLIRLPEQIRIAVKEVTDAAARHAQRTGRDMAPAELACELGMDEERVAYLLALAAAPLSMERPLGTEADSQSLADLLEDPTAGGEFDKVLDAMTAAPLREVFASLPPEQGQVLALRYGLVDGQTKTLGEVGRLLSMPPVDVRKLESAACATLRSRADEIRAQVA